MDISYNWLQEFVEIDTDSEKLADELTLIGLELDGMHQTADDTIYDLEITSNRGDCLSHLGVAREVSTLKNRPLDMEKFTVQKPAAIDNRLVEIEAPELCHRFTARIIRNVTIGESPDWLKKRLAALGERPINNVADITNYVMLELGQPMHAFDLAKLRENRIVVRRARQGEKIITLDETERVLDETMLAICDAERPVAVAGVMGGFNSSITPETTDVLLEVAYFDSHNIRQTSRRLNLSTEASYRFERGVDIENLIRASNRAVSLISDLAGGEAAELADNYATEFIPAEIRSEDLSRAVKRLSGLDVKPEDCRRILSALGIRQKSEKIFVSPTWRHDLTIEEDLVEEVVRIVGYDRVGEEIPAATSAGGYQPDEMRKRLLRQTLSAMGFDEAISYSFINEKFDETFELVPNFTDAGGERPFVSVRDPIIEGSTRMRPSLLPGLLDAVRTNFNQQKRDLKIFEIGKAFASSTDEQETPDERELFALVMTGGERLENKALAVREFDFYDAKGAVEAALHSLNLENAEFSAVRARHLRPGQAAEIAIEGRPVGFLGRLNDQISSGYKFRQPVYLAELDLQTLLEAKEQEVRYRPLPLYPSVIRDVSLLIKRQISFAQIRKSILSENYELLKSVDFVDVYEGKGIADDERSLTIRLSYRSDQRTLLEEEVEEIHGRIVTGLEQKFGAKQRI